MDRLPLALRVVIPVPRDRSAKVIALESRRAARRALRRAQTEERPRPTAA